MVAALLAIIRCRGSVSAFTHPKININSIKHFNGRLQYSAPSSSTIATSISSSTSSTSSEAEKVESSQELTDTSSVTTLVNNRISIGSYTSLDARTVTQDIDLVLSHLQSRRASDETLNAAKTIESELESKRKELIQARDKALQIRNEQSALIGQLMRKRGSDEFDEVAVEEAKALSARAADDASLVEESLSGLQSEISTLLSSLPNLLDDIVPDGEDESENEEVSTWGDIETLPKRHNWPESFEPKWHDDVADGLNGWQSENAVAMSGARFVALSGHVARLERAISTFFMDLHTMEHGYREVSVPFVVGRSALEGTSQLPKFEEDLFRITKESHSCNGEDAFLIPTAEVPVTNLHREQILEEADLPKKYVAFTPCFRAEAGSYGRDTKGLIRTHQFSKVELVKITTSETSVQEHEELTRHAQICLEKLELPYRKVRLCSGDVGFSARHCYDLEVWLPGSEEYREISSCSNTGDFQAKRMGLRYRPVAATSANDDDKKNTGGGKKKKAKKPKPVFCHTINGSGLAVGRTLLAVLENYQMPDGSVVVPDVLRPYMGGLEILKVD